MKKLGLVVLISLCSIMAKAASLYIGCLHGIYFIAKYDDNGKLIYRALGPGCAQGWVMQIYMIANPITPTGAEFDHNTENRINAIPVEKYAMPQNETEILQIDELVKECEGKHVYVNAAALNPEVRKFLFDN